MDSEKFEIYVKSKGVCCACEQLLKDSQFLNMVGLDKKANWKYPTWGHISIKEPGRAVAVICDECGKKIEGRKLAGEEIKYAVEWDGHSLHYHLVVELEGVPPVEELTRHAAIKQWDIARQASITSP